MTYFDKENKSFHYKKDKEWLIEVRETKEQLIHMKLEEVRGRIKYYVEKYTDSEYSDMKNYIE